MPIDGTLAGRGHAHVAKPRYPLDPAFGVHMNQQRRARLTAQMEAALAPVQTGAAGFTPRIGIKRDPKGEERLAPAQSEGRSVRRQPASLPPA